MAATYVTKAELRTNLGIGTLYSDAVVEEVCQTAEDLLNSYLWFDSLFLISLFSLGIILTFLVAIVLFSLALRLLMIPIILLFLMVKRLV